VRNGFVKKTSSGCDIECSAGFNKVDKYCLCRDGFYYDKNGTCVKTDDHEPFYEKFVRGHLDQTLSKLSPSDPIIGPLLKLKSGEYRIGIARTISRMRTPQRHFYAELCIDNIERLSGNINPDLYCCYILQRTYGLVDKSGDVIPADISAWFDYFAYPNVYSHARMLAIPGKSQSDVDLICAKEVVAGDLFAFIKSVEDGEPKSQFLNGEGCCDELPNETRNGCKRIYLKGENTEEVCKKRVNP
jgi:hypothetical protein